MKFKDYDRMTRINFPFLFPFSLSMTSYLFNIYPISISCLMKHNILVPAFRLENLNREEKKALTLKNLKNEIWSWNKAYNFDEATEDLF